MSIKFFSSVSSRHSAHVQLSCSDLKGVFCFVSFSFFVISINRQHDYHRQHENAKSVIIFVIVVITVTIVVINTMVVADWAGMNYHAVN